MGVDEVAFGWGVYPHQRRFQRAMHASTARAAFGRDAFTSMISKPKLAPSVTFGSDSELVLGLVATAVLFFVSVAGLSPEEYDPKTNTWKRRFLGEIGEILKPKKTKK